MGTGNTSTSGLVREEVETAVVALELLAIRNGNAAEVAAVVSSAGHRTPPGIRAWYRRALVELDRKAGAV